MKVLFQILIVLESLKQNKKFLKWKEAGTKNVPARMKKKINTRKTLLSLSCLLIYYVNVKILCFLLKKI